MNNLLCPLSPIYRREKGGGCRPARPGEQDCFHQKAPPSVGTFWKAQVGLIAICTPFLLNTPLLCFFVESFLKRYRLRNDIHFVSRMFAELHGLRNNACFFLPECCETLQIT